MEKEKILNVVFYGDKTTGDLYGSYVFKEGLEPIQGSVADGYDACEQLRKERPNSKAIEAFYNEGKYNNKYIYMLDAAEFRENYESFQKSTENPLYPRFSEDGIEDDIIDDIDDDIENDVEDDIEDDIIDDIENDVEDDIEDDRENDIEGIKNLRKSRKQKGIAIALAVILTGTIAGAASTIKKSIDGINPDSRENNSTTSQSYVIDDPDEDVDDDTIDEEPIIEEPTTEEKTTKEQTTTEVPTTTQQVTNAPSTTAPYTYSRQEQTTARRQNDYDSNDYVTEARPTTPSYHEEHTTRTTEAPTSASSNDYSDDDYGNNNGGMYEYEEPWSDSENDYVYSNDPEAVSVEAIADYVIAQMSKPSASQNEVKILTK